MLVLMMRTRTIRQKAFFKASAHELYEMLMDSKKHGEFSGGKCSISRKVGGKISISDGYITGENVELVKDRKIVQKWKAEEDCWPDDHYSTATFKLTPVKGKDGTGLYFTQTGVPAGCGDRFDTGWKEYYWRPMKEMLERESGRSSED